MAVTIVKKDLTILSLAERLFAPEGAITPEVLYQAEFLHHHECKLVLTPTRIEIQADAGKDMATIAVVPLKVATLTLALQNKVGTSVLDAIRKKVRGLINIAHEKYLSVNGPHFTGIDLSKTESATAIFNIDETVYVGDGAEFQAEIMDIAFKNGEVHNKVAAIKKYRELTNCSLKDAKDKVEGWIQEYYDSVDAGPELTITVPSDSKGNVTVTSMYVKANLDAAPCQLEDATVLHQPVYGTGPNSRYHVVAISDDCVVAARIKKTNYKTGIRVLPKNNVMPKSKLLAAGLKETDGPHFSVHLDAGTIDMAQRSIGSTLFSLGHDFKHVSSDLALLVGAGK